MTTTKPPAPRKGHTHTHTLKTWPVFFQAVEDGTKTFEVRAADRDFRVGDVLDLREYDPDNKVHTGRSTQRQVSYLLSPESEFGFDGFVVLGMVTPVEPEPDPAVTTYSELPEGSTRFRWLDPELDEGVCTLNGLGWTNEDGDLYRNEDQCRGDEPVRHLSDIEVAEHFCPEGASVVRRGQLSVMYMYLSKADVHGVPVVCVDGEPHTRLDTNEECHRDSGWGWGDAVNELVASVVEHEEPGSHVHRGSVTTVDGQLFGLLGRFHTREWMERVQGQIAALLAADAFLVPNSALSAKDQSAQRDASPESEPDDLLERLGPHNADILRGCGVPPADRKPTEDRSKPAPGWDEPDSTQWFSRGPDRHLAGPFMSRMAFVEHTWKQRDAEQARREGGEP